MNKYESDTRITAYIFGELDPDQLQQFESEMQSSPELRREVSETRETMSWVESQLTESEELALNSEQTQAIFEASSNDSTSPSAAPPFVAPAKPEKQSEHSREWNSLRWIGVAACVGLIGATSWAVWQGSQTQLQLAEANQSNAEAESLLANSDRQNRKWSESKDMLDADELVSLAQPTGAPNTDLSTAVANDGVSVASAEQSPMELKKFAPAVVSASEHSVASNSVENVELRGANASTVRRMAEVELIRRDRLLDQRALPLAQQTTNNLLSKVDRYGFDGDPDDGRGAGVGGDQFDHIVENEFIRVSSEPLSTFSIDVDTASYSKVRNYLQQLGRLPRPDAVRIEELVNYFTYDYSAPVDEHPFAANLAVATCPWDSNHRLVRVAVKGQDIEFDQRPSSNLVFLLDVSGSMDNPNKLPLVKKGMKMLVDQLGENDRLAIVVYAGAAGLVLESTPCNQKDKVLHALDQLKAGGSTNGGEGLQLAYREAMDHFVPGGVNRIILCTDGDFNVGNTGTDGLIRLVEENAKSRVDLTVLGFGMGNHNDAMLEQITNKGNGNYGFIDTEQEAKRMLVEQINGTLVTIAKDVKIQVEFNPQHVYAYRLLGYENRLLAAQDFNDDTKDAGEIGAGHTVTALYEVVPVGAEESVAIPTVDPLKYQTDGERAVPTSDELLTLKLRYKQPTEDVSTKVEFPLIDADQSFGEMDPDFRFAAAVAGWGMLLRESQFKGDLTFGAVLEIATEAAQGDDSGYRDEFLELVRRSQELSGQH